MMPLFWGHQHKYQHHHYQHSIGNNLKPASPPPPLTQHVPPHATIMMAPCPHLTLTHLIQPQASTCSSSSSASFPPHPHPPHSSPLICHNDKNSALHSPRPHPPCPSNVMTTAHCPCLGVPPHAKVKAMVPCSHLLLIHLVHSPTCNNNNNPVYLLQT